MSEMRTIPAAVTRAQREASDPALSAFVSANAGAGKTYVLVQRVVRLMLEGASPEKILCITFTKAAAANMASRLFHHLAGWIALSDEALDDVLEQIGKGKSNQGLRRRARELFARALETPGGIKVQTIHALCTRILQQFPVEANVSARFHVLDERDTHAMFEQAINTLLFSSIDDPDGEQAKLLATLQRHVNDKPLLQILKQAALNRSAYIQDNDPHSLIDADLVLRDILDVRDNKTPEAILKSIIHPALIDANEWLAIAQACDTGTVNDKNMSSRIHAMLKSDGNQRVSLYREIFFTQKDEARKNLLTATLAKANPDIAARLTAEQLRVTNLIDAYNNAIAYERSLALIKAARLIRRYYNEEKQRRGALDYDDLIDKTAALLANTNADWVHYKLDMGIDHILLDEAQDTNARQWEIVANLIKEFTSGEGARDHTRRSLFAVGDEKQSIYSFQGASRDQMQHWLKTFEREFSRAQKSFKEVRFSHSFRSGKTILDAVTTTFSDPALYPAITSDKDGMPPHLPLDDAPSGTIELWAPVARDEKPKSSPWNQPFDVQHASSAPVKLAINIAHYIRDLIGGAQAIGRANETRAIAAKDILILVRSRNVLFNTIIAALKRAQIPVAGADRLKLTDHQSIIDLMNLADAILLPHDDLALASALKSPLFGFNDDHLMSFAPQRKGTLRDALRERAAHDDFSRDANFRLERYEHEARTQTPFGFFAWLLGGDGGRRKLFARLSPEASDALDEFLEIALAYEERETPSLQGFLAWLRRADTDVKRDMNANRNEVRVMTVHGAKGLEAPVVILADTTFTMEKPEHDNLQEIASAAYPALPSAPVWLRSKPTDSTRLADMRTTALQEARAEELRLLYVAMTRAAERLVVAGHIPGNQKTIKPDTWYDLIEKGLTHASLARETLSYAFGEAKLYYTDTPKPASESRPTPGDEKDDADAAPLWLAQMPASDIRMVEPVRPSQALDERATRPLASSEDAVARMRALERGTLTHRLLQSLPNLAPEIRKAAARQFLSRNAAHWDAQARDALAAKTLAVLNDPRLATLFLPGSRAEVSIAGRLARAARPDALVSGQIDRLVIAPERVLIADYKTNATPPAKGEEPPEPYVAQLALYRAVLAKIYPDKPIDAWLIWTETLEITHLSETQMEAALSRIISS